MATNDTQDKTSDLFRITNTKVIGLLAAALIFVTSYIATNVINSPHSRIDKLVEELEELDVGDRLFLMEYTLDHIKEDDEECKTRQEALVGRFNSLSETVTNYQAETKRWDTQQDRMIDDCMRRTQ